MGVTAFILVGSHPHTTYGLPNPGYILMLYENDAPAWELVPLYPELEKNIKDGIIWIASIEHMLEDALVMIGLYIARNKELRELAYSIIGRPLEKRVEVYSLGDEMDKLREVARRVLQRHDIGLVVVPLSDSTILNQIDVLKYYGDLWVSINPPMSYKFLSQENILK